MSPGEIGRTLVRIEHKTDELTKGFDGWREIVIEMRHAVAENTKDIARIEAEREEERKAAVKAKEDADAQRKSDRRLIFVALVGPAIMVLFTFGMQILLTVTGVLK